MAKVQLLMEQGLPTKEACARSRMTTAYFYSLRSKAAAAKRKLINRKVATYEALPMVREQGVFELKGSPEMVARFVKELGRQHE